MLVYALLLWAESKAFLLSSMEDQFVNEFVQNIVVVSCQFFNVEFLDTLMVCEFCSWIFLVANLTHNWNFRAISFDMIIELSSSQMLILFSVADVTSEFWARVLSMSLEFSKGLPDNFTSTIIKVASMRELTEVNTVLKNFVNFLKEITSGLTVWAANIIIWSNDFIHSLLPLPHIFTSSNAIFCGHSSISSSSISTCGRELLKSWVNHVSILIIKSSIGHHWVCSFLKLNLAIFAEKLVARFALKSFIWELLTNYALNLFNHLSLEFILNFIHFNVEGWDWLWSHNLLNCLVCND